MRLDITHRGEHLLSVYAATSVRLAPCHPDATILRPGRRTTRIGQPAGLRSTKMCWRASYPRRWLCLLTARKPLAATTTSTNQTEFDLRQSPEGGSDPGRRKLHAVVIPERAPRAQTSAAGGASAGSASGRRRCDSFQRIVRLRAGPCHLDRPLPALRGTFPRRGNFPAADAGDSARPGP